MMDVHTPEQRHHNMSRIRSANTKPEIKMMKALKSKGIWFTHHRKDVFGKPDIVFKRKKVAVFIDSEFWHGKKHLPKSNQAFWTEKFERNRRRDLEVNKTLTEQGWTVLRFSDEEVKKDVDGCLERILAATGKTVRIVNTGEERGILPFSADAKESREQGPESVSDNE